MPDCWRYGEGQECLIVDILFCLSMTVIHYITLLLHDSSLFVNILA